LEFRFGGKSAESLTSRLVVIRTRKNGWRVPWFFPPMTIGVPGCGVAGRDEAAIEFHRLGCSISGWVSSLPRKQESPMSGFGADGTHPHPDPRRATEGIRDAEDLSSFNPAAEAEF